MGRVLNYNYSQCRVSNDGKYLLPDDVYLLPIGDNIMKSMLITLTTGANTHPSHRKLSVNINLQVGGLVRI